MVVVRPLAATEELVTIRKAEIRRRNLSQTSNMPTGILNTLHDTEILDTALAYPV